MTPVNFTGANVCFGKHQSQYLPLPARLCDGSEGRVVCCWKLTWRERLSLLFSGLLWTQLLTFNRPIQPHKVTVEKPDLTFAPAPHPIEQ